MFNPQRKHPTPPLRGEEVKVGSKQIVLLSHQFIVRVGSKQIVLLSHQFIVKVGSK